MLFNSFEYLVFLPVVVLAYWLVPRQVKPVLLIAASYFFYMYSFRIYAEKYEGRYPFSAFVFGFDLFLLGLAAALFLFVLVFAFHGAGPEDGGLDLTLTAPPLRASDEVVVTAVLRAKDGKDHEDVRFQWRLPEWVEIVRAEPPLRKDGSITVGRLAPGVESA